MEVSDFSVVTLIDMSEMSVRSPLLWMAGALVAAILRYSLWSAERRVEVCTQDVFSHLSSVMWRRCL